MVVFVVGKVALVAVEAEVWWSCCVIVSRVYILLFWFVVLCLAVVVGWCGGTG